jgi:hypothetical protein
MKNDRYVIECRDSRGQLDFTVPQPENVFGLEAITGITEDAMAKKIFSRKPEATLQGDSIATWPALLDPRWKARLRTW